MPHTLVVKQLAECLSMVFNNAGLESGAKMRLADEDAKKLYPKLSLISNGNNEVNGIRAELSSIVASAIKPDEVAPSPKVESELVKPAMLFDVFRL
jgi:hypothetical protein